jgi:hypothetical protein
MNALIWLCNKSIEIRTKKAKKKEEEAEEDTTCEKGVIYDEDEDESFPIGSDDEDDESDWEIDSEDELDKDLYDT